MTTDLDRAIRTAWQCCADACLEHDCAHETRAIAELVRLRQLKQREDSDAVVT